VGALNLNRRRWYVILHDDRVVTVWDRYQGPQCAGWIMGQYDTRRNADTVAEAVRRAVEIMGEENEKVY
jgi:hypothetical protein